MSADFSFTIPGQPPSVNHLYSRGRGGHVYKSEGVERYQTEVALLTRLARPKGWLPAAQVRIDYDFMLWRRADCDNLKKALNDAIAIALGVDDDIFLGCDRSKVLVPKADAAVKVTITND